MKVVGEPVEAGIGTAPAVIAQTLPEGTRLQEYRLTGVIGQGGFGVVYRAEDLALQRPVAIKEYLPAQLAARAADGTLRPSGERHAETFAAGLEGFLDEARLLARFKHPNLLEVLRFWKQNGTAYLAMPLYAGRTLDRLIAARPGGLEPGALRAVLDSLLAALEAMHAGGCVHRDVSPDNVMVLPDGGAVLLDLGAARRVIGDRVKAVTVMLKGGYAPIEQYADDPAFRIGPWTDVYELGAVLHHAITGEAPPAAPMRMMRDTLRPLAARGIAGHDPRLLAAVDATLALRPEDRPQSIAALRELIGAPDAADGAAPADAAATASPAPAFPARIDADRAVAVDAPSGRRGTARGSARGATPTAAAPAPADATGSAPAAVAPADGRRPAPQAVAGDPVAASAGADAQPLAVAPTRPPIADAAIPHDAAALAAPAGRSPAWMLGAATVVAVAAVLAWMVSARTGTVAEVAPVQASTPAPAAIGATPASRTADAPRGGIGTPATPVPFGPATAEAPASVASAAGAASGVAAAPSDAPGTLRLAVTPWAEIWIDGESHGVTPPTKSIRLAPGTYRVELRNPAAEPSVHRIEVVAGRPVTLTHRIRDSER